MGAKPEDQAMKNIVFEFVGVSRKAAILAAVAVVAGSFALAAPVSIDLSAKSAFAGAGDGNFGQGKGNGGPNGQDPGNPGNGGKGGNGGSGEGGNGDAGDGGDNPGGNNPVIPGGGGAAEDDLPGDAAEGLADGLTQADVGSHADAEAAANGLPSVTELFALGAEGVVSAEEELKLIANGWASAD